MTKLILFFSLLFSTSTFGQTTPTVSVIDFVRVKDNKWAEAIFFYENNWKAYREIALRSNYIVSYQFLKTPADSVANFDLMLITEYADSIQFSLAENRFQEIIKQTRPNGPKLMNDVKPNDFRKIVFTKQTQALFSSRKYHLKNIEFPPLEALKKQQHNVILVGEVNVSLTAYAKAF